MTEHAAARDRSLRRGLLGALVFRVASALGPLLVVPLALESLGAPTYGVWLTIMSLTAFFAFGDLGLGNLLMTRLAGLDPESDEDSATIRRWLASSYFLTGAIAVGASALVMLVGFALPWPRILSLPQTWTVRWIFVIAVGSFALNIVASLVVRIQLAFQQSGSSYLWQSAGPALSLVMAAWVTAADGPALMLVAGVSAAPVVVNVVNTTVWFRRHSAIRPARRDVYLQQATVAIRGGLEFVVIGILMAVASNLDVMLIPQFFDPAEVTEYAVPWRLFSQVGLVLSLLSIPFWAASADALRRGDRTWVMRRARSMALVNLAVIVPLSCIIVLFGDPLFDLWLSGQLQVNPVLLAGFGTWWMVMAVVYPYFMVQNGAGVLRPQMVGWAAFLAISLIGKPVALSLSGFVVLPWLSVLTYLVTVLPSAAVGYRRSISLGGRRAKDA